MTFDPFDVVTVPFPFADRAQSVVRPAVVLSQHDGFGARTGIVLTATITSAKASGWPLDVAIADLDSAGLRVPCVVRMKIGSIDQTLIERKIGTLADPDRATVRESLRTVFGGVLQ